MKVNVENVKIDFRSNHQNNTENTDVRNSDEGGSVEIGKVEFEMTPEEILEYIKTAPGVVKDALAFARDALAMQKEMIKEEAKKVVTD